MRSAENEQSGGGEQLSGWELLRPISLEELGLYLSGEADAALKLRVEVQAGNDPRFRRELRAWQARHKHLTAAITASTTPARGAVPVLRRRWVVAGALSTLFAAVAATYLTLTLSLPFINSCSATNNRLATICVPLYSLPADSQDAKLVVYFKEQGGRPTSPVPLRLDKRQGASLAVARAWVPAGATMVKAEFQMNGQRVANASAFEAVDGLIPGRNVLSFVPSLDNRAQTDIWDKWAGLLRQGLDPGTQGMAAPAGTDFRRCSPVGLRDRHWQAISAAGRSQPQQQLEHAVVYFDDVHVEDNQGTVWLDDDFESTPVGRYPEAPLRNLWRGRDASVVVFDGQNALRCDYFNQWNRHDGILLREQDLRERGVTALSYSVRFWIPNDSAGVDVGLLRPVHGHQGGGPAYEFAATVAHLQVANGRVALPESGHGVQPLPCPSRMWHTLQASYNIITRRAVFVLDGVKAYKLQRDPGYFPLPRSDDTLLEPDDALDPKDWQFTWFAFGGVYTAPGAAK